MQTLSIITKDDLDDLKNEIISEVRNIVTPKKKEYIAGDKRYITVKEAAERMGCSEATIRKRCKDGVYNFRRDGGKTILVDVGSL